MRWRTRRLLRGAGIPPTGFKQLTAFVAGGDEGPDGLRLLLLLVALLLVCSCENVKCQFMPLETGNIWNYRVTSGGRELTTESLRVVEELDSTVIDDEELKRFKMEEPDTVAVWTTYERSVMRSAGGSFITVIQHPPFVGTGWTGIAEFVGFKVRSLEDVEVADPSVSEKTS